MVRQSGAGTTSSTDQEKHTLDPSQFDIYRNIIDAAPDCISLIGLDSFIIQMNRAAREAASLGDCEPNHRSWFDFVPPESVENCKEQFKIALSGEPARFSLTTDITGKTFYWDIVFSPVRNSDGEIACILSVGRDVTANHSLDVALVEASAREKLVTQEMQHRIKNLFSVVSVLITMAEREADNDGKPETLAPILKAKIHALARASEATYLRTKIPTDLLPEDDGHHIDVSRLLGAVLAPYASMVRLKGLTLLTSRKNVTTLTLFLHELATNSVKYGALSQETGHVDLEWEQEGSMLRLIWTETGGPEISEEPSRSGFGSTMIDRLITLAGGKIERDWQRQGLITNLVLPNGDM